MTKKTTIAVDKHVKEAAQESKHDNETWNQFIQRCTETPPEIVEYVDRDEVGQVQDFDESELANEVATQLQLDMAQLASKTADEVERRLR